MRRSMEVKKHLCYRRSRRGGRYQPPIRRRLTAPTGLKAIRILFLSTSSFFFLSQNKRQANERQPRQWCQRRYNGKGCGQSRRNYFVVVTGRYLRRSGRYSGNPWRELCLVRRRREVTIMLSTFIIPLSKTFCVTRNETGDWSVVRLARKPTRN